MEGRRFRYFTSASAQHAGARSTRREPQSCAAEAGIALDPAKCASGPDQKTPTGKTALRNQPANTRSTRGENSRRSGKRAGRFATPSGMADSFLYFARCAARPMHSTPTMTTTRSGFPFVGFAVLITDSGTKKTKPLTENSATSREEAEEEKQTGLAL